MSTDPSSTDDSSASLHDEDICAPLTAFEDEMYEYIQQASDRHYFLNGAHKRRVMRHEGDARLGEYTVDFMWYLNYARSMARSRHLRVARKRPVV